MTDYEMLEHLAKQALDISENITTLIKEEEVDQVLVALNDRGRIINIVNSLLNNVDKNTLDLHCPDFSRIINYISDLDILIETDLISLKKQTHLEIAKTFKTKENFKRYDLNNIK